MRLFIVLLMFSSFLFSKECYYNKVNNICYYKYFKKSNIHESKADELYYINAKGSIYTFDKIIEVKFNSIGAIFIILNDLELEFVDKIKKETYLFKVQDRQDLFSTISKLNRLKTVMKAQPHRTRKYTKSYIIAQREAKKARFEAAMQKAQTNISNKNNSNRAEPKRHIGFTIDGEEDKQQKSFLKGNVEK